MANSKSFLDDPAVAVSISIILFGIALGLPSISFGKFGWDFGTFPTTTISVMRLGIISLAIAIGLKPLGD